MLIGACSLQAVFALEPGALNPTKPSYQLPALPKLHRDKPASLEKSQQGQRHRYRHSGVKFILRAIRFEGNDAVSDEQLQAAVAAYINQAVTRLDLEQIRLILINYYQQLGYVYPSVILPSQHISSGVVRYQISESRIVSINIRGNEGLNKQYISGLMQLDTQKPIQKSVLLDGFQQILADPMIERVNGTVKPGAKAGETILDLDVARAKPYALYLGMDNATPPSVGSYTGRLSGVLRNLTGTGDLLQMDFSGSEGMQGMSAFFSIPLNYKGWYFNLGFQSSQARVVEQAVLQRLNIKNKFLAFQTGIGYSLLRGLKQQLNVELQYAFRQTNTTVAGFKVALSEGVELSGRAGVNELRFIQNYAFRGGNDVVSFRSSLNVGFDGFDATINPNQQADSRYLSWLGQLRFLHRVESLDAEWFVRADVQLASEALLPLQRFALGGVRTVRGYRMNELVRDEGFAGAVELRYPLWKQDMRQGHRFDLVPFVDYGRAWNRDELGKTLFSAGVGMKWRWRQWGAAFYWAQALNGADSAGSLHDAQDSGFHFSIQTRLL